MKLRFFATILLTLTIIAVLLSILHFSFFQDERLRLIDYQIENSASILISSNLSRDQLQDFDRADQIIHTVFGDDRLNTLVVIYDSSGRAVYKSRNARVLPPKINFDQWQTIEYQSHFIRLLTLPWSDRGLILQVGLVLDDDRVRWKLATRNLTSYTILIIILVFLVTLLLTRTLLKPMRKLSQYLQFLSERFDRGVLSTQAIPDIDLPEVQEGYWSDKDEFLQLTRDVRALSQKLRDSVKVTQKGTAQLAHELKTPLTIIRNHLELGERSTSLAEKSRHSTEALQELDQMNLLVEDFLNWARTENLPSSAFEVHAIHLDKLILDDVKKLDEVFPNRLVMGEIDALQIFARQSFVNQVVNNLLTNALKYSTGKIEISLVDGVFEVRDFGPGISDGVLKKIGEPFNSEKVEGSKGSGLGLAWVMSICKKYSWSLELINERELGREGLRSRVNFGKQD